MTPRSPVRSWQARDVSWVLDVVPVQRSMGEDKPVLVIGGTRGTGLLIAEALIRQGAAVRVLARDPAYAARRLDRATEIVPGNDSDRAVLPAARIAPQSCPTPRSEASLLRGDARTVRPRSNRIMESPLDVVGVRVLGSLIEKEITTPDNYPLTLNALTAACNQTSNREPVLEVDEATVSKSLDDLGRRSLVRAVHRSDSRVRRYRHLMTESLKLHAAETAVMCVLMLRGPQTAGEIRTRTVRLFEFTDVAHVDITLQALMTLSPPLVAQLPRRPGQKEVRYAHLLSGEPQVDTLEQSAADDSREPSRVEALEQAVASLRAEMAELRARFEEFRRAFE
jgi:uncharacterized protein